MSKETKKPEAASEETATPKAESVNLNEDLAKKISAMLDNGAPKIIVQKNLDWKDYAAIAALSIVGGGLGSGLAIKYLNK